MFNPTQRATLIGLLAVLCWSSTVALFRSVAEALGPVGGAACVFTASALCLLLVRGLPRKADVMKASRWYLIGGGLLFACYEICFSVAIGLAHDRQQSLELGMINYLWPCLTIVLAVLLRQQRARWWLWPGLFLCLWGLQMVLASGGASGAEPALHDAPWWESMAAHMAANPLAYALASGAALLWPVYSLLARRFGQGFNGVVLFLALTAALLWLKWLLAQEAPMRWSGAVVLQLLALGALTALGYSCWDHGMQHGNLAILAAGSYFTPVFSAIWVCILLAVQPSAGVWYGVVMITAGSLLCWLATRRAASAIARD